MAKCGISLYEIQISISHLSSNPPKPVPKTIPVSGFVNLNVLMKVGYQGVKNCYSYQVLDKYLQDIKPVGYNNFDIIFLK